MRIVFLAVAVLLLPVLAAATIHQIDVSDFAFTPTKTQVIPGDTVRWVLVSGVHTTTSDNTGSGKTWDSGPMTMPGQNFDVVFTTADGPGPFPYHCSLHPQMADTIFFGGCTVTGDVNNDGIMLSVADMMELVMVVKRMEPMPPDPWDLDMNRDCAIDDGDVDMFMCYFLHGLQCTGWEFPPLVCCFPDTIVGASCIGDSCSLRTQANALAMGATYFGNGTSCSGVMPCCCVGVRGNVDGDQDEIVDISDLSMYVGYLFFSEPVSTNCSSELNIDGIGSPDISDLTVLVDFLFGGGTIPSCIP